MRLRVLVPETVALDQSVQKVSAEAEDGSFCLLPRHVDFVASLLPGLLSFTDQEGQESFLAVDRGTLVKCGDDVTVSTPRAIRNRPLGELQQAVRELLRVSDERERRAQAALAKIEADLLRRFIELSGVER